jgi:outer membrane protein assembly factor BamB
MVVGGETQILFFHAAGLSGHAADDGRELWTMPWTTPYDVNATTPVVRDNEVFITSGYGTGGALLEVAGDDYRVVWSNNALAAQHSDPVLIDGHLYGYTGDSNGRGSAFVCLEWATGNEKWRTNELGWGTVTWVDGRLLCQDRASNLYLVQAEPEGLTIQTTFQNAIPGIRQSALTVPVAANDKLYLRYRQLLVCYDLRKP